MNTRTIEITEKERTFIQAYFNAVEFTDPCEIDGDELGLCDMWVRENQIDCLAFYGRIECYLSDDNQEQAGHDFWLTRNGHGTGFWDRDDDVYPEHLRTMFTTISESFGPSDVIFADGHEQIRDEA